MKPSSFVLTADLLIAFEDEKDNRFVLLQRHDAIKDIWTLPNEKVLAKESSLEAAHRHLKDKIGIAIDKNMLTFFNMYDEPTRCTKDREVSAVYFHFLEDTILIKMAAHTPWIVQSKWFNVNGLPPMVMDHSRIIQDFIEQQYPVMC